MKLNLSLKTAHIPRNKQGDPAFTQLTPVSDDESDQQPSVLQVFSPSEVVELVNRALYQLEYQRMSHAKRQREQTEVLAPVKRAAKRLHPNIPWSKMSPTEVNAVLEQLKLHPELGEEDNATKNV